ncbi:hypothetical protein EJ110_NYTH53276 [Nymphaea thermarum]|nr:hypothetical protein EJ110_NYTH53276 [Nymphaea thermarum]
MGRRWALLAMLIWDPDSLLDPCWAVERAQVYYGIENSFWSLAPHIVQIIYKRNYIPLTRVSLTVQPLILGCQHPSSLAFLILPAADDSHVDQSLFALDLHRKMQEKRWLLGTYNTHILLIVFLAVVSLLLAGFFIYHAHLCLSNTTTNETFKWADYISWKTRVNKAKASSAALKEGACRGGLVYGKSHFQERRCIWPFSAWRWEEEEAAASKENLYDQGMLYNLFEIICPLSERASFSRRKAL